MNDLTKKMVKIEGILYYKKKADSTIDLDRADTYISQIAQDAVYGSFGTFPSFWNDKWESSTKDLCTHSIEDRIDDHVFRFVLYLSSDLFPIRRGGLQHLISTLSGDLFERTIDSEVESVKVKSVEIPQKMHDEALTAFRGDRLHHIDNIIKAFCLDKSEMPLLAFSFKPRTGISYEELKKVTLGVLKAGFNLVELDTRNLAVREEDIKHLVDLAKKAAALNCKHVTRFSPNLSVPASLVVDLAQEFIQVQESPIVIKIDGGLDGISACQAVRQKYNSEGEFSPIITCYPLLRKQLNNRITGDFFIKALALSGADIIYPGGRPNLGSSGGLGVSASGALKNAVRRYRNMDKTGWPMPTIAGGVHAGELYSFYTLFGQRVAYFLGGAVALHENGPIEGAKLCVRIFKEAVQKCKSQTVGGRPKDLSTHLIEDIESAYNPKLPYISPSNKLFSRPGLTPFWENL